MKRSRLVSALAGLGLAFALTAGGGIAASIAVAGKAPAASGGAQTNGVIWT